jgi:hypothetical protein
VTVVTENWDDFKAIQYSNSQSGSKTGSWQEKKGRKTPPLQGTTVLFVRRTTVPGALARRLLFLPLFFLPALLQIENYCIQYHCPVKLIKASDFFS